MLIGDPDSRTVGKVILLLLLFCKARDAKMETGKDFLFWLSKIEVGDAKMENIMKSVRNMKVCFRLLVDVE